MKSIVSRRPLVSYFILAYGITWGGIILLFASNGFQFEVMSQMQNVMVMFLFMLLGPSLSSIIIHGLLEGHGGLSELLKRATHWRIRLGWYAAALLTMPVLLWAIFSVLKLLLSADFTPSFQFVGIAIGLLAGGLEELGWTGFATPRLLEKFKPLKAGLILGILWAFWHMMADFMGNYSIMGANWPANFLLFWILPLPAYRILMTYVYSHTKSIPIAQLMHASYTGWLLVLSPLQTTFSQNLLWQTILGLSLWGIVMVIAILNGRGERKLSQVGL